jgi:hypothetical protein
MNNIKISNRLNATTTTSAYHYGSKPKAVKKISLAFFNIAIIYFSLNFVM